MLVTTPSNLDEAKMLSPFTSYFLVGIKGFIPNFFNTLTKDDFLKLLELKKKVILRLDVLVRERELKPYLSLIDELKDLDIYYYITDQGLLNYLLSLGLGKKTIYDPFTMITNMMDAKTYYDLGLLAVAPSLEIPFKDILEFAVPLFYLGFGRRLMFNSKRNLVSLYKEKSGLKFSLKNLTIVEEKREDVLPIFEDKGTYIYRSYFLNNLKLIKESKNNINFVLLDSLTLSFDTYLEIVKRAHLYLNGLTDNIDLVDLDLDIEEGFTYLDTIYQKEAIIDAKN